MSDSILKKCSKCKKTYPRTTEYFHKDGQKRDGLCSPCKLCVNVRNNKWKTNNPEKYSASISRWNDTHREERNETAREWRRRNPDKVKNSQARYRDNNREKRNDATRKWRNNNIERVHENNRQWYKTHREHARIKSQRRRARIRQLPHDLTVAEWETILASYGYSCAYCGKSWLDCKLAQEHVIPIVQGGGYTKNNMVPACPTCNSKKKDRTPEQAGMKLRDKIN